MADDGRLHSGGCVCAEAFAFAGSGAGTTGTKTSTAASCGTKINDASEKTKQGSSGICRCHLPRIGASRSTGDGYYCDRAFGRTCIPGLFICPVFLDRIRSCLQTAGCCKGSGEQEDGGNAFDRTPVSSPIQ